MGMTYKYHVTNDELRNKSGMLFGHEKISPLSEKQIEMVWAHNKIDRTSNDGLLKMILQGTTHGEREGKSGRKRDEKAT